MIKTSYFQRDELSKYLLLNARRLIASHTPAPLTIFILLIIVEYEPLAVQILF